MIGNTISLFYLRPVFENILKIAVRTYKNASPLLMSRVDALTIKQTVTVLALAKTLLIKVRLGNSE